MIPHKNLFSGALGKLENIGGSRIYTTPHTVSVPAEYSINVTMNIQGNLVGHSLDGRLWLYRRSRRLGIIALKWNTENSELEYATGLNISNNDDVVLACGLDWVLTNNNIFMVTDKGEILSARLFNDNIPSTFLYSLLRSGSIGASGIDPFTGQAWGKRDDNGNSEGTGYFSKSTRLLYPAGSHSFEQCYSLLPPVGDWQIFENFLVRRPDAESISSYNYMQSVRPLIPLEFANGSPMYGTGYNFDHRGIQLAHRKGEFWAKGFQTIGKVSLLPAVFGENGSVLEFYLYIQPDFTLYPYSDFFYCSISTFDVNPDKYLIEDDETLADYEPIMHSFAVSSTPRNWAEAKAICETLGGHLATSTTADKNRFLTSLSTAGCWLGATDEAKKGRWMWITGEDWYYSNWAGSQPDNADNSEHYLMTNFGEAGLWNDSSSTATLLYICEWDYELNENDFLGCLWPNIAPAPIGSEALYGFLSEQADALSGSSCFKSIDGRVLLPESGELLTLSENNARIFFDTLSYKGLLLDDDGGQLMLGEGITDAQDVNCKTLQQWLAPAGQIDAVTDDYIAASADNSAFCTSLITGFNRQFLSPNTIPLTASAFQDSNEVFYRLAISEGANENSRKVFGINKLLSQDVTPEAIDWQNIYKEPVKVTFIKAIDQPNRERFCRSFSYDSNDTSGEDNVVDYGGYPISDYFIYGQEITLYMAHVREDYYSEGRNSYYNTYIDTNYSFTSSEGIANYTTYQVMPYGDPYPELSEVEQYVILSASTKVIFLNPLDGSLHTVSFSRSFQQSFRDTTEPWGRDTLHRHFVSRAEVPYGIGYTENQIGFYGFVYDIDKNHIFGPGDHIGISNAPYVFFPCADLPDFIALLRPNEGEEYIQPSIISPNHNNVIGWNDNERYCNFIFQENSLGVKFFQQSSIHLNSVFSSYSPNTANTFPNYGTKFIDSAGINRSKQNFHITETINEATDNFKLLLFHSEVFPEILDFPAEAERSKSH